MLRDAPPYQQIAELLTQGKVVIFLGPLANRLPKEDWQSRPGLSPTDIELAPALAMNYDVSFETSNPLQLIEVASYIQERYGRYELIDKLHNILGGNYEPHGLYAYLASIPTPLVIVTTNYDDLVEQAFIKAHHPFHRISMIADSDDLGHRFSCSWREKEDLTDSVLLWKHSAAEPKVTFFEALDIDPNQTTVIIKLRGTVDRRNLSADQRWDSLLITEDDYLNFLTRLSKQQVIPGVLARYFAESNYLFCGYGLPSLNLRLLLKSLIRVWRSDRERRNRTWIFESNPTSYAVEFWRNRNADIYDETTDSVAHNLGDQERQIIKGTLNRMNSKMIGKASPTVFISYAREDAAQAKAVYKALKANGFKPWRDKEKIFPGEEWDHKIRQSLKQSDFLLVCLSTTQVIRAIAIGWRRRNI